MKRCRMCFGIVALCLVAGASLAADEGQRQVSEAEIPALLAAVQQGLESAGGPNAGQAKKAMEKLETSTNPQVLKFLSEAVIKKDKWGFYRDAYQALGRNGGKKEIDLVLSLRNRLRTIESIDHFFGRCELTPEQVGSFDQATMIRLVATWKDFEGRSWGFLTCPILGHWRDLWVAIYEKKRWVHATYTGEYDEKPESVNWLAKYVNKPELSKDSDSDGWSDLIEQRLGTNPRKADTDGDGLRDSQDKNPLTRPRATGDTEEILSAALAYCRLYMGWTVPYAVRFPKGVEPFELTENNWVTLPKVGQDKGSYSEYITRSTEVCWFGPPRNDFQGNRLDVKALDSPVVFNEDHTKAMVSCGRSGGYWTDIRLRKVDGGWVVTEVGVLILE